MSIYIGNDLEDRLEALEALETVDRIKTLETENVLLKKHNEYHQLVHEINHMSDLHLDSSFYKQSMDIDIYFKIKEWHDSSIGQSTVIQRLDKKDLHYQIKTKHKIGEGMLTFKTGHILFVASISIIRRQLFVLHSE